MVVVRNTLWGIGTLFAVSLALLVSGATVVVMVCLLMLADLTDNFRGDAIGQALLHRAGIGQTNGSEFGPDSTANLRRMPLTLLRSKLSDARFDQRHKSMHSADDRAND
jgi:hypothetical protein